MDVKRILAEAKANVEPQLLASHQKAGARLTGVCERLKRDIIKMSENIVMDIEPPFMMEKRPKQVKPDDYKTLEELWAVCTLEETSRVGESHSDARTIDVMEFSEEGAARSNAISLVNLIFEGWQSARQEITSSIEKGSPKIVGLSDELALSQDIKSLFWGKQRVLLLQKLKQSKPKSEVKMVLDLFYKKQPIPDSQHHTLVEGLLKALTDKYKIDNNAKLEKVFEGLNLDLQDILQQLPTSKSSTSLLSHLESHYRPAMEKRYLYDLDSTLASVVSHFKNYKTQLDKTPPAEGLVQGESEYAWSDKPGDRVAYSKAADIRMALTTKFRDVIDLDFPKADGRPNKTALLKAWDSKYAPVQLANLNHVVAVEHMIKSCLKPLLDSVLSKAGYDMGAKKLVHQLYRSSLKLTLRLLTAAEQTHSATPESQRAADDARYFLACLDGLQQAFIRNGLRHLIDRYTFVYASHKRKLQRAVRRNFIGRLNAVLQSGFFGQDWMDFHRFSRAKKPGAPIDSLECEGLHAAWLMLAAKLRQLVQSYLIRGIDQSLTLVPLCYLLVDFFFEVYSLFATTPVSVQRSELFVGDLKLSIGLLESVYFLFTNLTSTIQPDGRTAFKLFWPKKGFVDPIEFMILSKKIQLVKAHMKVLYKILSLNANNIEEQLKELQGGLYKNRKIMAMFPEIYRKAFEMIDNLAKENQNLKDLMEEIGQPIHTETPMSDSHRLFDTQGSLGNLKSRPFENKLAELENFSNVGSIANDLFESNVAFTVSLEYIDDPEDKWLSRVDKFLRELSEPPQKMVDEFVNVCKIGKKEVILTSEESDLVIFSKRRDYFLNRPELLDKDSELSTAALSIKNKIRQII